jgi:hypothetical protein
MRGRRRARPPGPAPGRASCRSAAPRCRRRWSTELPPICAVPSEPKLNGNSRSARAPRPAPRRACSRPRRSSNSCRRRSADAVHAAHRQHDLRAALVGRRAAAVAGVAAVRHHRDPVAIANPRSWRPRRYRAAAAPAAWIRDRGRKSPTKGDIRATLQPAAARRRRRAARRGRGARRRGMNGRNLARRDRGLVKSICTSPSCRSSNPPSQ